MEIIFLRVNNGGGITGPVYCILRITGPVWTKPMWDRGCSKEELDEAEGLIREGPSENTGGIEPTVFLSSAKLLPDQAEL